MVEKLRELHNRGSFELYSTALAYDAGWKDKFIFYKPLSVKLFFLPNWLQYRGDGVQPNMQ